MQFFVGTSVYTENISILNEPKIEDIGLELNF